MLKDKIKSIAASSSKEKSDLSPQLKESRDCCEWLKEEVVRLEAELDDRDGYDRASKVRKLEDDLDFERTVISLHSARIVELDKEVHSTKVKIEILKMASASGTEEGTAAVAEQMEKFVNALAVNQRELEIEKLAVEFFGKDVVFESRIKEENKVLARSLRKKLLEIEGGKTKELERKLETEISKNKSLKHRLNELVSKYWNKFKEMKAVIDAQSDATHNLKGHFFVLLLLLLFRDSSEPAQDRRSP